MSTPKLTALDPSKDETVVISTRLPRRLVAFLDATGEELSNSRNGIVEFAVKTFEAGYEAAKAAAEAAKAADSAAPNPVIAAAATLAIRAA